MNDRATPQSPKLLDQLRAALRVKHYAYRTEKSYVYWVRRFIYFHQKKHPRSMGTCEVQAALSYLAQHEYVSASTQNQALNALVFLYKQVIQKELGSIDAVRARRPKRLPVVLTQSEVEKILAFLSGTPAIMATLLYGSGLRLMECHRLRVKDIDFEQHQIIVRDGKGFKDRVTVLPEPVLPELKNHLSKPRLCIRSFPEEGMEKWSYRMRLRGNIRTPNTNGGGNMHFPHRTSLPTYAQEPEDDIIFMKAPYNGQSRKQPGLPISTNTLDAIHFVTVLLPICWNPVLIFAPCKSY